MNLVGLCLCLSLSFSGPSEDSWFAEDKFRHFFASFVLTSLATGGARTTGLEARTSRVLGAGVGLGLGIWKEIRDVRAGGHASARDLVWDVAGVAAATAVAAQGR